MCPQDADRMANSVDPDQTTPDLRLHCLTCLTENISNMVHTYNFIQFVGDLSELTYTQQIPHT